MNILNSILSLLVGLCFSVFVQAAGGGHYLPHDHANLPEGEKTSLQKGARLYMDYCFGCHSLKFQRYGRMAKDLGISEETLLNNFIVDDAKPGDLMTIAMSDNYAENWFGTIPPDLSVVARARGTDWLYNYLRAFYKDDNPDRTYGYNNTVFKDVGMPHVLEPLQGVQIKTEQVEVLESKILDARNTMSSANSIKSEAKNALDKSKKKKTDRNTVNDLEKKYKEAKKNAKKVKKEQEKIIKQYEKELIKLSKNGQYFKLVSDGLLSPQEYDDAMRDLVNFLDYTGEPAKLERKSMGVYVLLFIFIFFVFAYLLKKEYWRDIH